VDCKKLVSGAFRNHAIVTKSICNGSGCRKFIYNTYLRTLHKDYNRGGQTAALRTFTCDSELCEKLYILFFISIAKRRKIVKWYCGS